MPAPAERMLIIRFDPPRVDIVANDFAEQQELEVIADLLVRVASTIQATKRCQSGSGRK